MQQQFDHIEKQIAILEDNKTDILQIWVTKDDVQRVLQHHDIGVNFFSKYFGVKIIEYALGVIKKKNKLGNCPVVGVMLHFFEKKNIPLEDVFTICVNLKNTLLGYMLKKELLNQSILFELNTLMDYNFSGVIHEYLHIHYDTEAKYESCSLSLPLLSTITNKEKTEFSYTSKDGHVKIQLDPLLLEVLVELENAIFALLNTGNTITEMHILKTIDLLTDYNYIFEQLPDYGELYLSLTDFISTLKAFNLAKANLNSGLFINEIKTLIDDLSMWRITVLIEKSVKNIHYVDQSILSTISGIEALLLESKNSFEININSIQETQQSIHVLMDMRESIITSWLEHVDIILLLKKYGIDGWYYKEHYAYLMYDRLIQYLIGNEKPHSFAAIHIMIDYFHNRDFTPPDMYTFFKIYRQCILKIFNIQISLSPLYEKVQNFLDQEYIEALDYFNQSIFGKRNDYKGQLALFWQYQKMIDKSAIVSKGDLRGVITYINQQFCDISGYKPEELLGKPHSIVRHPDTPDEVFKELWETIQSKKIFKATIKNRKKNGEAYYVDSTIVPILDENNDIIQYISMRYDVTKLVEAIEVADKAKRIRDEFLANMSHEIRTPLNGIIGFVEILLKQNNDKRSNHFLEIIHSSAQMLLRIVNDVLELSKLQSGKFQIELLPFNPIEEVGAVISLFNSKICEKSLQYVVYIDPNIPRCLYGDGGRIKQVVSNFLSNAIKFTPKGGLIKVKAVYEKNNLKVMVQDNGIGINTEQQKKIFYAFEQADVSITRSFGGTGLGLSISTELINNMQGKLLFRSVENKGSTFGFEIPCAICDEKSNELSIKGRYTSLRIGILIDPNENGLTHLIDKYLQDYGIQSIQKLQGIEEENLDLIFCPSSMLNTIQNEQVKIPVVVLENSLSEIENKKQYKKILYSPFLPNDIETIFEEIRTK